MKLTGGGNGLYGVHFANNKTGVVVGGSAYLIKTTDQGVNWTSIFPSKGDKTNDYFRSVLLCLRRSILLLVKKRIQNLV